METVLDQISAYEIERGKPMPNLTHGSIQANLIAQLIINYDDRYRIASEVSLATIPDGTTPDIVVYAERNLNFINENAKQTEAPLLTIEIQSPSQSPEEMVDKALQYFRFGVQSSWIVFPALQAVAVYTTPNSYLFFHDGQILKDKNLDIELNLKKIFR